MNLFKFTAIATVSLIIYTIAYTIDNARLSPPVVVLWAICVIVCAVAYIMLLASLSTGAWDMTMDDDDEAEGVIA